MNEGHILIYNTSTPTLKWKIKYWFAYLQKVFSKGIRKNLMTPITFDEIPTHVASFAGHLATLNAGGQVVGQPRPMILEAGSYEVKVSPYWRPKWKFTYSSITDEQWNGVVTRVMRNFLQKQYGYFQLITFLKRQIWGIFKKDTRNIGVWIVGGVICTEADYWAMTYANEYIGTLRQFFDNYLNQWNSNSVYPIEILEICEVMQLMGIGKLEKLY